MSTERGEKKEVIEEKKKHVTPENKRNLSLHQILTVTDTIKLFWPVSGDLLL